MSVEKDRTVQLEDARDGELPAVQHDEGDDKMSFQAWMAAIVRSLYATTHFPCY